MFEISKNLYELLKGIAEMFSLNAQKLLELDENFSKTENFNRDWIVQFADF